MQSFRSASMGQSRFWFMEKRFSPLPLTHDVVMMLAIEAMLRVLFTSCSLSWFGLKPPQLLSLLLRPSLIGRTLVLRQMHQFAYLTSDLCEKMLQSLSHTVAFLCQKIFSLCRESVLISCGLFVHTQDLQGTVVFLFCRDLVKTISVSILFYFSVLGSTLRQWR